MSQIPDALMKELKAKFEQKMKENEISTLEYWKTQVDRLLNLKPEGIAALQLQIKRLSEMMENRIKTLKKEMP